MFETIRYDVKDGIAWLYLNRPDKLNAFIAQMNREVKDAIKAASNDEKFVVLSLRAKDGHFVPDRIYRKSMKIWIMVKC